MIVDWRALLDYIHVPWRDRGANTSRGNLNVNCPYCISDPSFHMAISTEREAYYCWRDPRHSGHDFIRILVRLGQTREAATSLLNRFRAGGYVEPKDIEPDKRDKFVNAWDRFSPAQDSQRMIDYLGKRGFPSPKQLCELYDFRYAKVGQWANRLLIPLHHEGKMITWTGRDVSGHSELRYKLNAINGYTPCYSPDRRKRDATTLIIVEGPLGALRISCVSRREPWRAMATMGIGIGPARLLNIRHAAKGIVNILFVPDPGVPMSHTFSIIAQIASVAKSRYIGRASLPRGLTGPDELEINGVTQWVRESLSRLRTNETSVREYS